MRLPILTIILLFAITLLVDWLIGRMAVRNQWGRTRRWVHLIASVLGLALLVVTVSLPRRSGADGTLTAIMWLLYAWMSIYIPKIIALVFSGLSLIPCLWRGRAWKPLQWIGVVLGIALFLLMWHGALVNARSLQVNEVEVEMAGLPPSMDGMRIVQLSDAHVGTYGSDNDFLERMVERVNALEPDAIVFTGDIVNRHTSELEPHAATLSRLQSPEGVIAILGNHDYGDYYQWNSPEEKRQNMEALYSLYRRMGWTLLRDSTMAITRGNDSLMVIGVENIGEAPFPTYGSLSRAYSTPGDSLPKILLSHNPRHWVDSVSGNDGLNIPLTLSGHTHAMQMELLGRSPSALRYPTWGGMYTNDNNTKQLYVNIGIGTVGFPARLGGATPEITVLKLRSPKKANRFIQQ